MPPLGCRGGPDALRPMPSHGTILAVRDPTISCCAHSSRLRRKHQDRPHSFRSPGRLSPLSAGLCPCSQPPCWIKSSCQLSRGLMTSFCHLPWPFRPTALSEVRPFRRSWLLTVPSGKLSMPSSVIIHGHCPTASTKLLSAVRTFHQHCSHDPVRCMSLTRVSPRLLTRLLLCLQVRATSGSASNSTSAPARASIL